ncbi:MAG: protealysin inhibitor emfourin, partial [Pseudonocardia sp.]
VGVTTGATPAPGQPPASGHVVEVRRSGGFAGISTSGTVDLDHDERAEEVRALLDRIDVASLRKGSPQPDRFVYQFRLEDREITVHEQELTDDLQRLAELVLRSADRM